MTNFAALLARQDRRREGYNKNSVVSVTSSCEKVELLKVRPILRGGCPLNSRASFTSCLVEAEPCALSLHRVWIVWAGAVITARNYRVCMHEISLYARVLRDVRSNARINWDVRGYSRIDREIRNDRRRVGLGHASRICEHKRCGIDRHNLK